MYGGGYLLDGIVNDGAESADDLVAFVLAESEEAGFDGGAVYSNASDFFFQVVFVATAMSIVSGAVAERMKLWAFLLFTVVMTGVIYPIEGAGPGADSRSSAGLSSVLARPAFQTLQVQESYTWQAPPPLLRECCYSVQEKANSVLTAKPMLCQEQTCRSQHWVLSFFGWDGLDLTAVRF